MSFRKGKGFDHQRMQDDWYDTLTNPVTFGRFTTLLVDYGAYLRIHREQDECEPDDQEQETAAKFAELIDDTIAWPQAQQYIPQLRIQNVDEIPEKIHCKLWSIIFTVIRHRLQPSQSTIAPTTLERAGVPDGQECSAQSVSKWVTTLSSPFNHIKKKRDSVASRLELDEQAPPQYDNSKSGGYREAGGSLRAEDQSEASS